MITDGFFKLIIRYNEGFCLLIPESQKLIFAS